MGRVEVGVEQEQVVVGVGDEDGRVVVHVLDVDEYFGEGFVAAVSADYVDAD